MSVLPPATPSGAQAVAAQKTTHTHTHESWVERLWCVFELAGFLKAHPEGTSVQIRPVGMGVAAAATCIACTLISCAVLLAPIKDLLVLWAILSGIVVSQGMYMLPVFRAYFRSLQATNLRLRDFRLQESICWCCSVNHVDPNGQRIEVCDREIVRQCVTSWFGSEEEFDKAVRSFVVQKIKNELGDPFPYAWILASTAPIAWTFMDVVTTYQKLEKDRFLVPFYIIRTLTFWFWGMPLVATAGLYFARRLNAKANSRGHELLRNLLCVLGTAPAGLLVVVLHVSTEITFYGKNETLGSLIFAGVILVIFLVSRRAYHRSNARYFESLGLDA